MIVQRFVLLPFKHQHWCIHDTIAGRCLLSLQMYVPMPRRWTTSRALCITPPTATSSSSATSTTIIPWRCIARARWDSTGTTPSSAVTRPVTWTVPTVRYSWTSCQLHNVTSGQRERQTDRQRQRQTERDRERERRKLCFIS